MTTDRKQRLGVVEEILETHCEAWPSGVPLPVGATPFTAQVVLHYTGYGEDDVEVSVFDRALCHAAFVGDRVERGKLHHRFPEMVEAVELYERAGLAAVLDLAAREATE